MARPRLLLEASPTGVEHYAEVDHDGDELTLIEYTPTSVENQILKSCEDLRSMTHRRGTSMQMAARVPILTWRQWRKEWEDKYQQDMSWGQFEVMKINSREFGKLRVGQKDHMFGKKL